MSTFHIHLTHQTGGFATDQKFTIDVRTPPGELIAALSFSLHDPIHPTLADGLSVSFACDNAQRFALLAAVLNTIDDAVLDDDALMTDCLVRGDLTFEL
jgi:hypothetical protein